jgi:DNA-binding GntR family transcriptional regulator
MSLTQKAYQRIRNAIVHGGLQFGEQLSETQIAKSLGMSKAPVRAAFIQLKDKGLVNIVPQSGTYVFSPTAEDVRGLSHLRAVLENEALHEAMKHRPERLLQRLDGAVAEMKAALAAKNWPAYGSADNDYHRAIIEESGNPYLVSAYYLGAAALEALRVRLQAGGGFRDRSIGEHVEMAKLLRARKVTEAARLLTVHILIINDSLHILPLKSAQPAGQETLPLRQAEPVTQRKTRRRPARKTRGRRSGSGLSP